MEWRDKKGESSAEADLIGSICQIKQIIFHLEENTEPWSVCACVSPKGWHCDIDTLDVQPRIFGEIFWDFAGIMPLLQPLTTHVRIHRWFLPACYCGAFMLLFYFAYSFYFVN